MLACSLSGFSCIQTSNNNDETKKDNLATPNCLDYQLVTCPSINLLLTSDEVGLGIDIESDTGRDDSMNDLTDVKPV